MTEYYTERSSETFEATDQIAEISRSGSEAEARVQGIVAPEEISPNHGLDIMSSTLFAITGLIFDEPHFEIADVAGVAEELPAHLLFPLFFAAGAIIIPRLSPDARLELYRIVINSSSALGLLGGAAALEDLISVSDLDVSFKFEVERSSEDPRSLVVRQVEVRISIPLDLAPVPP